MDRCATVRWITRPSAARDAISGRLLLAVLVVSILIATGFSGRRLDGASFCRRSCRTLAGLAPFAPPCPRL